MDNSSAVGLMRRPLEARDFNQIAQWLRRAESDTRVSFLTDHIAHSAIYRLAISTINNRTEAYQFLRFGLDSIHSAHSQKTKAVAQFGVTKLGGKRTIAEIASRINSQPHVVDMALYWLPSMISRKDPAYFPLQDLRKRAAELGITKPARRTVNSDGSVTFSDRYAD